MKQRLLSFGPAFHLGLLLALCVALTLTACGGQSASKQSKESNESEQSVEEAIRPGQASNDITEALKSGSTSEYEYKIYGDTAVITKYIGSQEATSLIVPNEFEGKPVVRIGDYDYGDVFNGLKKLERIELPDTLQELGGSTFYGCEKLKSIELPEYLTTIESSCFRSSGIETITIPSQVKTISLFMFQDCKSLAEVNLSEGLETIEPWAFKNCESLANIWLPDSLKTIGECAFESSGLLSAYIPSGVEEIGNGVYSYCKRLEIVDFFNYVKLIPEGAFRSCESLHSFTGLENLVEIGKQAFFGCKTLTEIGLFEGLKKIGDSAFEHSSLRVLDLPSTVEKIGDSAFYGCEDLHEVMLPSSIKTIGKNAFVTGSNTESIVSILVYGLHMPVPEMKDAFPNDVCFVIAEDAETTMRLEAEIKAKMPNTRFDFENFYYDESEFDITDSIEYGGDPFSDTLLTYGQSRKVAFADLKDLNADNVPELVVISFLLEDELNKVAFIDIYQLKNGSAVKSNSFDVGAEQSSSMNYSSKNGQYYVSVSSSTLRPGVTAYYDDYIGVDGFHESLIALGDYHVSEVLECTRTLNGVTSKITEEEIAKIRDSYKEESYIISGGGLNWSDWEDKDSQGHHISYTNVLEQLRNQ